MDGSAALRALRRQLEVFTQQGALDAETRAQLAAVIDEQERRLVQKGGGAWPVPPQLPPVRRGNGGTFGAGGQFARGY